MLSISDLHRAQPWSICFRVRDVLIKNGQVAQATEFIDRAEGCKTLPELVALAREYVHLDLQG